jgi:hypothetical protein
MSSRIEVALQAARNRLRRLAAEEVPDAIRHGAILVDIRPAAQRAAEGGVPAALVIERNVLEWRCDPTSEARLPQSTGWEVNPSGAGTWNSGESLEASLSATYTGAGLSVDGVPMVSPSPGAALVLALVFWGSVLLTLTSAWLTPDQFVWSGRMNWGKWTKGALAGVLGMLVGLLVSRAVSGDLGQLLDGQRLLSTFWRGLPWMIGALAVMGLITGAVAHLSRWRLQIQVRSLRLAAERDAASRDAAEARLKLLQAQIRPHFIFNTLSAVQHWVDQADPRGAPLLRSLTAFLRGSTDMMGRDAVPLAHEMTMVGHYLDIMKARLGDRLHCVVDPPAAHFHDLMLPPGLVLTLVENAIEHGVEPLLRGGGVEVRLQESSEALCIDVLDEGPGLPDPLREGVGLSNTRARLAQALGPQARLELCNRPSPDQGCWARIVTPLPGSAPSSTHSISHLNAHPVSS